MASHHPTRSGAARTASSALKDRCAWSDNHAATSCNTSLFLADATTAFGAIEVGSRTALISTSTMRPGASLRKFFTRHHLTRYFRSSVSFRATGHAPISSPLQYDESVTVAPFV